MKEAEIEKASQEATQKIANLAQKVFKVPLENITPAQLASLATMTMSIMPKTLSVRVVETRRTSVQYCSNTYEGELELDLSGIPEVISLAVEEAEKKGESILDKFSEQSRLAQELIAAKFEQTEHMLKCAIRDAEAKDKIEQIPNSRFSISR